MRVCLHEHIEAPVTAREGGSPGSEDVLNPSTLLNFEKDDSRLTVQMLFSYQSVSFIS
jgi:hypothetical protein